MPHASAIAIRDDRIMAVGNKETVANAVGVGAQQIDLQGCMVLPGLTDSHFHFGHWTLELERVNMDQACSFSEVLQRIEKHAQKSSHQSWVLGFGWNRNEWTENRLPNRWDLDAVTNGRPAFLLSKDGHLAWVNSAALAIAGLNKESADPADGSFDRNANGELLGILRERAMNLVENVIPQPSQEELVATMVKGFPIAHRYGITSIHAPEKGLFQQAYRYLARERRLGLRINMMVWLEELDEILASGVRTGDGDAWLRIGPVKIIADGALGGQTALMLEPYVGDKQNTGIPVVWGEDLLEGIRKATLGGLATATHAIGDLATRECLNALSAVGKESRRQGLVHRIEHAQLLRPSDIPRLSQLGVVASVQPLHCPSDRYVADRHWGARARYAYAFRSLLESGALLIFGSDAPVESPNPLLGIHAAVTRQRATEPESNPWYPQERIPVESALFAYTMGPAIASGEGSIKGSITPGKLADLTILDKDLTRIPTGEIPYVKVAGTLLNGSFVYRDF